MTIRRRRRRGFTLVELTVALVAGLIVALGIMALSKETTRTFNEEMRGAAAEATLRTAMDRLRSDLQRAGYMSTGNILADTTIARSPSAPSNVSTIDGTMKGILGLASIQLTQGGSVSLNGLTLSAQQSPALTPDSFLVSGNLTTTEQFEVQAIVTNNAQATISVPAGCTEILLSPLSPAIYRIGVGTQSASQELCNVFQPVPQGMNTQFIVRLVDTTGHSQYLATCQAPNGSVGGPAGLGGQGYSQPYVLVDTTHTPIQYAQNTGTQSGVAGICTGCMVNPVQTVRWEITTQAQEQANQPQFPTALGYQPNTPSAIDATKYDLMRTYMDATGTAVPATSELVAEYAVDLKLAFSVDSSTLGPTEPVQGIVTYTFDDATNATWAPNLLTTTPTPGTGPQRIRSARVRVVTRAAQADRTVNVPLTNFGNQEFMYRYCVAAPCLAFGAQANDQTLHWARARTMTTEVSLPNQSRFFY